MPISQERLIKLQHLTRAMPAGYTFDIPLDEASELIDELLAYRGGKYTSAPPKPRLTEALHLDALDAQDQRIATLEKRLDAHTLHNNALVDGQNALERRVDKLENLTERLNTNATAAGAATTVEDALNAVPAADDSPPHRGDRVRLEGAYSRGGVTINSDWYNVIGQSGSSFQIIVPIVNDIPWAPWVHNDEPGLKEVRRGAANLSA